MIPAAPCHGVLFLSHRDSQPDRKSLDIQAAFSFPFHAKEVKISGCVGA